jgi:ligand-binding sensor domain-containing protein
LHNGLGFSIYDRQNNEITLHLSNTKTPIDIRGFANSDDHTFWLYTPEGLFLYDTENNSLKKLISKTNPNILKITQQAGIIYDDNGILWIPTQSNGLAKVDIKNKTVSYLTENEGLTDNRGTVAKISKEGEIWVATENGISILNLEQNTLTILKE